MLGAPFAEEQGGLGGGALENMIVMEELGKVIAIEPYLQTVVIGGGALKAVGGAQADAVIPRDHRAARRSSPLPMPSRRAATTSPTSRTTAKKDGAGYVLNGHKAVVYAAPWATHLLVTARTGGSAREREGVALFLIDAKRRASSAATIRPSTASARRKSISRMSRFPAMRCSAAKASAAADRAGRRRSDRRGLRRGQRRRCASCTKARWNIRKQRKQFGEPIAQVPGAAAPHGRHVHGGRADRAR